MNRLAIVPLLLLGLAGSAPAADSKSFEVGLAKVDITPEFPVRMGGYLVRTKELVGVDQKVYAKALAISAPGRGPVVLISVDTLGVSDAAVSALAERLAKEGVSRESLTVSASHTHSAPCLTDVAPHIFGKKLVDEEQERVDRYTGIFRKKLEEVALAALKDRKPATLSWAEGKTGFAANRRTKGGPIDHALPVLRIASPDGKVRGVVVNYACHCTTCFPAVNKVSGDWAGHAQAEIEADFPGAIAMTVIGCGADANPTKPRGQSEESCRIHGRGIADEVKRLFAGPMVSLNEFPVTKLRKFRLALESAPTRDQLKALIEKGGPPGYNASVFLARLDRGEAIPETVEYSVQTWAFGDDLLMVFLPGEVVVDYVLRIKKELDGRRVWVTAYSNDAPCYIPSERILREGGYEGGGAMVYYAQPTKFKAGLENVIIDEVKAQAPAAYKRITAGPGTPPSMSPEDSLKAIVVPKGFKVELVAAEPLVVDPVAIDWGTDGKLWVCEMRDYPTGIDGNWKPGGTVSYLEDTDKDGKYDKSTLFATGYPFPTGVMAWRKGVLLSAAPEIIYLEDTDGDGKADLKKVLFRGFATENYQARVNGLSYNLDNWVHGANGLIGGSIKGTATGKTVDIGGRDFRIRPDTGVMEPASGLTQQGRIHDDWGNQFGGNNSAWIQNYPFPDHYARRNPDVAVPGPTVYLPQGPESSRIYPAGELGERYNHPESANHVTSACSPMIYRDALLPGLKGNAFICEPVHNVVHREVVEPKGVTFASHRAPGEDASEFLGSTDHWFRPVQVRTGPDGAIYVVDMYRYVIEHPRWISPERLASLNFRAGDAMGRIYRVVPDGTPARPIPVLDSLSTPELAKAIDSPNGTLRDNVQRLMVHRGDTGAGPGLREVAAKSAHPEARVQALCAIEGLHALTPGDVLNGLKDPHPGVRRQAVRLAEPFLGKDEAIGARVLALATDRDAPLRFQVALSLGGWDDLRSSKALANIALGEGSDAWLVGAVISSSANRPGAILAEILGIPGDPESATRRSMLGSILKTLAAEGTRPELEKALKALVTDKVEVWRLEALATLFEADDRPGERSGMVRKLAAEPGFADRLASYRDAVRKWTESEKAGNRQRLAGFRLLGRFGEDNPTVDAILAARLSPQEPDATQRAALRAAARIASAGSRRTVLDAWSGFGPGVRSEALEVLLARNEGAIALLDRIKAGSIRPAEVPASFRQRLLKEESVDLKARAEAVFGAASGSKQRQEVLDRFLKASVNGDRVRGQAVFGRVCATCHKVEGKGHEVGPDLLALTDRTREGLSIAVLDPNRDVDARYAQYNVSLRDGKVLNGLIASETANAVTLKGPEGRTEAILRADIDEVKTQGQSLMPEGLEKDLTPQDLADVIVYLNEQGPRPKSYPGNSPALVVQAEDGTIRLKASEAEIYGNSLAFEPRHGNLGLWHGDDDRAAWSVEVKTPGAYTISIEWACDAGSAGNPYQIQAGDRTVRGVVGSTGRGGWDQYRSIFVAETRLSKGKQRVEIRPIGVPRGALLDLKAVVLTPRNDGVKAR